MSELWIADWPRRSLLDFKNRRFKRPDADLRRNLFRNFAKGLRAWRVGLRDNDRLTDVRLRADRKIQRDLAKERKAQFVCGPFFGSRKISVDFPETS